ncbi:MAG: eCIS core domain-containing protein [Methylobacter sp.]
MGNQTYQQRSNQDNRIPVGQRRTEGGKALEDNRAAFNATPLLGAIKKSGFLVEQQTQLAAMSHSNPSMTAQRQRLDNLTGGSTLQLKEEQVASAQRVEAPTLSNNTGLPDQLKSGIESLSGLSMDSVKVHYNSTKPAQLNALAYAQGTDIHVGPGQEQHLPHEAWHVVQQAQGRVKPTIQLKDGIPVNDDIKLECEADRQGTKAMQMFRKPESISGYGSGVVQSAKPVVQRILDISKSQSDRNPYRELKYHDFKALNKRKHLGLTIQSWLWLKRVAASKYKVTFSTWKEAIATYDEYQEIKDQLSQPQPIKSKVFRFGKSEPEPLSMNDAHGIVAMGDWIESKFSVKNSTFVSPGGSADFFGTDMRMRGAKVVDIPLSGIKDENLQGQQRERAISFIENCFKGHNVATNIVVFDAISSGSALRLLKELIAEALHISEERIHLLALNNPPGSEGQKFIKDKHAQQIDVTGENKQHASYVKSRIEFQEYKDIGRKYPKNPVGELTEKTANQGLAENPGMNAKLMAILFAMHEVAAEDFVEKDDSDVDEENTSEEEI